VIRWRLCGVLLLAATVVSCATAPPTRVGNLCDIFDEKGSWYSKANKASKRWGSPIGVMMAMMYQESSFRATAKPPRKKILWVIPGPRLSSAYGYPQAKTATWKWYKKSSGNWGADRDKFGDAIDFIGWYNNQSKKSNNIALDDTYRLYLAYHEGHGGYAKGSYRQKKWLVNVAKKVSARASRYQQQLKGCEKRMQRGWWPF